jgi:hypothetical protein
VGLFFSLVTTWEDLLAYSHNILNRWKNYVCQLLYVHDINDVRHREMHTAEPLVPELNSVEVGIYIEKLKRYKSPAIDQTPAEVIQVGGNTLCSEIMNLLLLFGTRKTFHSSGRNLLLYLFIKKGDKTDS